MLAEEEIKKALLGRVDQSLKDLHDVSRAVFEAYVSGAYIHTEHFEQQIFVCTEKLEHELDYMLRCIENRRNDAMEK